MTLKGQRQLVKKSISAVPVVLLINIYIKTIWVKDNVLLPMVVDICRFRSVLYCQSLSDPKVHKVLVLYPVCVTVPKTFYGRNISPSN